MTDQDIVAELDAWLKRSAEWPTDESVGDEDMIQRARLELVALRLERDSARAQRNELERMLIEARAEALEEAAAVVDKQGYAWIAEDVLALKDKP